MKPLVLMIDSEFALHRGIAPAGVTATAFYLASPRAAHPWAPHEVAAITTRYRLPIYVAPLGLAQLGTGQGIADAHSAAVQLRALGIRGRRIARRRRVVALDVETQVAPAYVAGFAEQLAAEGYATMPYGSAWSLFANPVCRGYWAAAWDGTPAEYPHPGVIATQYTNAPLRGYDLSVINGDVPLADYGVSWARRILAELAAIKRQVLRRGHVTH